MGTGGDCLAGSKGLLITPSPGVTRSVDPYRVSHVTNGAAERKREREKKRRRTRREREAEGEGEDAVKLRRVSTATTTARLVLHERSLR